MRVVWVGLGVIAFFAVIGTMGENSGMPACDSFDAIYDAKMRFAECYSLNGGDEIKDIQNPTEVSFNEEKGTRYQGVELLAGGLPCPPFSLAGKQLGKDDERDLFPAGLRLIDEIKPRAVMIENVRGLMGAPFADYREYILKELDRMGYAAGWKLLNASEFGVPQLRPRAILVGVRKNISEFFDWPEPNKVKAPTVGETLYDLMASNGWKGAKQWAASQHRHDN